MHVSKIKQHPNGHFVLTIMGDYQRNTHSNTIIRMICARLQKIELLSMKKMLRDCKIWKHLIRDLKYNCAVLKYCTFQQSNVSELEAAWPYCLSNLRVLACFLPLDIRVLRFL